MIPLADGVGVEESNAVIKNVLPLGLVFLTDGALDCNFSGEI